MKLSRLLSSLIGTNNKKPAQRRSRSVQSLRHSLCIESLEMRAVFDASLPYCTAPVEAEVPVSAAAPQFHVVFAPGTSEEVMSAYDDIGPSENVGFDEFNFSDSSRWNRTTTNGSGLTQGDATIITWSMPPDGTPIPGYNGEPANPNNLRGFLSGIYGSNSSSSRAEDQPWFSVVKSVFDRWSAVSGVTYVYEAADDGASVGQGAGGALGVRGDVRLSGHYIDGPSNILAYNFFPTVGDMILDTGDSFFNNTSNNWLRLRNTMAHEAGHGLGLNHVGPTNGTKLMEPSISLGYDGPRADDILAINRGYGDRLEKSGGNNTATTATNLGSLDTGAFFVDTVSIDDDSDVDWFQFTVPAGREVSLTLNPTGSTYQSDSVTFNSLAQSDLTLALYDTNRTTLIASANLTTAGSPESLTSLLPGSGTYYVRITGTANAAQLYRLDGNLASVAPEPDAAVYDGAILITDGTGTVDFGQTLVGTPVTKTFTVKNVGLQNLVLNAPITVPAGFTLVQGFGQTTLTNGQSTTFTVRLNAAATASPSGTISFTSNDPNESPYNFTVGGSVIPPISLPFTDNFDRINSTDLGAAWTEQVGQLSLQNGTARSDSATGSLATLNGISRVDVSVSGAVNLGPGTIGRSMGFSARHQGPGENNQYIAALEHSDGTYKGVIYRNVQGTWTLLSTGTAAGGVGTLRFDVFGNTLKLFLNESLVTSIVDTALAGPGTVGIRSYGTGVTVDDFSAGLSGPTEPPTTPTDPQTLLSDNFTRPDSTSLGSQWTERAGDLAIRTNSIRSLNASNSLATINGLSATDVAISANVDLGSASVGRSIGFSARHQGPGENNQYIGVLEFSDGNYSGGIWRNINGNWTQISSGAATKGTGELRFEVQGSNLRLFLDGSLITSVVDSMLLGPGTAGVRSYGANVSLDNMLVTTLGTQAPPEPTPTALHQDDFGRADGTSLGANWSERAGDLILSNGRVQSQNQAGSLAVVNGINAVDVSISGDVALGAGTAGRSMGFSARNQGPGESNQYIGVLEFSNGSFKGVLWRNVAGNWTEIAVGTATGGTGRLRFDVQGNKLELYLNDALVVGVIDSAITTGGTVGIRSYGLGTTLDNFNALRM